MPSLADFMRPETTKAIRNMKAADRAASFRKTVYQSLQPTSSPKSKAWGRKQLKRIKYLRQQGRVEL